MRVIPSLKLSQESREKALGEFKSFHDTIASDLCLETEEKKKLRDDEAKEIIKRTCNVSSCAKVQLLEIDKRSQCLKELKEEGLSTR